MPPSTRSVVFLDTGRICNVRNDYPVSSRVGARLDRHYSIYKRVTLNGGSLTYILDLLEPLYKKKAKSLCHFGIYS